MQAVESPRVDSNFGRSIENLLSGIGSTIPKAKFGSAKTLLEISNHNTAVLYEYLSGFERLLNSDNNILKWIAIDVISNIIVANPRKLTPKLFQKLLLLISDKESMITAGHVIDNLGKVAKAKPSLSITITKRLLDLETSSRNQECKNILLGKAIVAFQQYFECIENKGEVIVFVERQLHNSRNATRLKAKAFLSAARQRSR